MAEPAAPASSPHPPGEAYLRLINRINGVILGGGELDKVLDQVVDVVRDVLHVQRASILLLEPLSNRLHVHAARGIPRREWPEISIPVGEGIAGRVVQDGMPLMARDVGETDLPAQGGRDYNDDSFISVPLMTQDRTMGVLNVNNRTDGVPLGEADFQLTLAVAALVSLAIENSNLLSNALTLQRHFRDVLSELQHGVICTDRFASVTLCNPVASRVLAVRGDEALGRALHTVLPAELRALIKTLIAEAEESASHVSRELDLPRLGSAEPLPVRVTLTMLRDAHAEVEAVVLVLEDLSLTREVEELRRLDELKSNFLAMVSHELRTPLTSIKGAVHLLASGAFEEDSDQRRPMYDLLRKNTERLIIQINNILDVNQLEHRTLTIFPRTLDLSALLRRMAESMQGEFEDKGVRLDLELPDKDEIEGDHERLVQVFSHLLDNALKFTPGGGSVNLSLRPDGEMDEVRIRDTGVGLEPDFHDKVFAKFFQLEHTLTRQAGGNGLGLYIAKGLVELHGGTVGFVPVEGPGAEVKVRLPRQGPDEGANLRQEADDE